MSDLPKDIEAFFPSQPQQTEFQVLSSGGKKHYTVTAFDGKPPRCTCTGYAISKNKMIKQLEMQGKGDEIVGWCSHIGKIIEEFGQQRLV